MNTEVIEESGDPDVDPERWGDLLEAIAVYRQAPAGRLDLIEKSHNRVVDRAKAAGLMTRYDVEAVMFLTELSGGVQISPREVLAMSMAMQATPPARVLGEMSEDKRRILAYEMKTVGASNLIDFALKLRKIKEGVPEEEEFLTRSVPIEAVFHQTGLSIQDSTVLDLFAKWGEIEVPLRRMGAWRVIHVDKDPLYRDQYQAQGGYRQDYVIADIFTQLPAIPQAAHASVQGITMIRPLGFDRSEYHYATPRTMMSAIDAFLPQNGWMFLAVDPGDRRGLDVSIPDSMRALYDDGQNVLLVKE